MNELGGPVPLSDQEEDGRDAWLADRAPGVTATEVALLVGGGIATRRRILKDKEEGSAFQGNSATRRGVRREPYIAAKVLRRFGIPANRRLWAQAPGSKWLATPDGLVLDYGPDEEIVGCEIKSTVDDWSKRVPRKYLDQIQWAMFVTGARRWLLAWEQCDEDGQPLALEPVYKWVERDDARIEKLLQAAERFVAWRDAGAPDLDEAVTEELDDALTRAADAKDRRDAAAAELKREEEIVRQFIAEHPTASADGLSLSGSNASLSYVPPSQVFDADAWARRAPRQAAIFAAAKEKYRKAGSPRLTISLHKPKVSATK